jgi:hypothetical protein
MKFFQKITNSAVAVLAGNNSATGSQNLFIDWRHCGWIA